ncbi:MAG: hypothetical protein U0166_21620 [Acidobacteriota bacterium]
MKEASVCVADAESGLVTEVASAGGASCGACKHECHPFLVGFSERPAGAIETLVRRSDRVHVLHSVRDGTSLCISARPAGSRAPLFDLTRALGDSLAAMRARSADEVVGKVLGGVPDLLAIGLLVLTSSGRVLYRNAAARRLFEEGRLRLEGGAIAAGTASETGRLRAAVRDGSGGAVTVTDRSGSAVRCLTRSCRQGGGDGRPLTIMFVDDGTLGLSLSRGVLRDLWGVTNAESGLIADVAKGESLAGSARAGGRSVETRRSQMKHVLSKTGARDRAELMRMLLLPMAVEEGSLPPGDVPRT